MSFIDDAKNEFDKVEDKVDNFVHHAEDDIKQDEKDVSKDVHEVEAEVKLDGETVIHDVETDVKQEEALFKDAEQHPSHIGADFKEGVSDAEHDVTREEGVVAKDASQVAQDVVTDVRAEAEKITAQLKADFEKANAAGPGHELTPNETPEAWANRINNPTAAANVNLPAAPNGPGPVATVAQGEADRITAERQEAVRQAQAETAAQQPQGPAAADSEDTATSTGVVPDNSPSTGNIEVVEPQSDEETQRAQDENSAAHEQHV